MCGIAGIAQSGTAPVALHTLASMLGAIRHRGPDGHGFYTGPGIGLGHVRLSVIDPEGGAQPMTNERGNVLVVFNGEIYNHAALRAELTARGHRFRTRSDTEVLVHGFEEWGDGLVPRLDGQFAFALYDRREHRLLLARDRFGIRPLFVAERAGSLHFASEIKALHASGEVPAGIDLEGLDEVFTFWGARAPRTTFRGIESLEPGTMLWWDRGRRRRQRYYALDYPGADREVDGAVERLDHLLRESVRQRLIADVPVGGYLSGGLDSSVTCALATRLGNAGLRSFSIAFEEEAYDESTYQREVADGLRTKHYIQRIAGKDIVEAFPKAVWHAETPLVRSAPAPMLLLARLTRGGGIKVVLTGEGADELFLGYDLFKETAIRLFCERRPESAIRPLLFDRIHPHLPGTRPRGDWWARSFLRAGDPSDPLRSHLRRYLMTARIKEFYDGEVRDRIAGFDPLEELRDSLPEGFARWEPLHRAAYLEMVTLLEPYLLSAQGDRMAMASGVESRYPFLDHRLFEFAARLPSRSKLLGLREKAILRRWAKGLLPPRIVERTKQPYLAPVLGAFFGERSPDYVEEMLSPDEVRSVGIFDPRAVGALRARCRSGRATGFGEGQALVAVLSTQLWHRQFLGRPSRPHPLSVSAADLVIRDTGDILAPPITTGIP